jgi:hypothetical protein
MPSAEPSISAAPTGSKKGGKGKKKDGKGKDSRTTRNGKGKGKIPSPPLPEGVIIDTIFEVSSGGVGCPQFFLETPTSDFIGLNPATEVIVGGVQEIADICTLRDVCAGVDAKVVIEGTPTAGVSSSGKGKGKSGDLEDPQVCRDIVTFDLFPPLA